MRAWTRTIGKSVAVAGLLAGAIMTPASAQAQDDCDPAAIDSENDAAKLFRCGKTYFSNEQFEESYRAYKRAYDIQPAYDVAANLGNVEVKLGKHCDAVRHLKYVLANLPPSLDADLRKNVIEKTNQRLKEALAHSAVIKVAIDPEGTQITVDGEVVGSTPLQDELVLCEGKHTLVATHEGYNTFEHSIEATGGMNETLRVPMSKIGDPDPVVAPKPGDGADGGGGPIWPLVIVGGVVGVGALAAGGGLFAVSTSKKSKREDLSAGLGDDACSKVPPEAVCADIADLTDQETTFSNAGIGLMVVGGVFLVGTAIYLGVALSGDDGDAQAASVRVLPLASSEGGGLLVSGSF